MNISQQIEIQMAWHNGATIKVKKHGSKTWMYCRYPTWKFETADYAVIKQERII